MSLCGAQKTSTQLFTRWAKLRVVFDETRIQDSFRVRLAAVTRRRFAGSNVRALLASRCFIRLFLSVFGAAWFGRICLGRGGLALSRRRRLDRLAINAGLPEATVPLLTADVSRAVPAKSSQKDQDLGHDMFEHIQSLKLADNGYFFWGAWSSVQASGAHSSFTSQELSASVFVLRPVSHNGSQAIFKRMCTSGVLRVHRLVKSQIFIP